MEIVITMVITAITTTIANDIFRPAVLRLKKFLVSLANEPISAPAPKKEEKMVVPSEPKQVNEIVNISFKRTAGGFTNRHLGDRWADHQADERIGSHQGPSGLR
jgi:hypothetical protein